MIQCLLGSRRVVHFDNNVDDDNDHSKNDNNDMQQPTLWSDAVDAFLAEGRGWRLDINDDDEEDDQGEGTMARTMGRVEHRAASGRGGQCG